MKHRDSETLRRDLFEWGETLRYVEANWASYLKATKPVLVAEPQILKSTQEQLPTFTVDCSVEAKSAAKNLKISLPRELIENFPDKIAFISVFAEAKQLWILPSTTLQKLGDRLDELEKTKPGIAAIIGSSFHRIELKDSALVLNPEIVEKTNFTAATSYRLLGRNNHLELFPA